VGGGRKHGPQPSGEVDRDPRFAEVVAPGAPMAAASHDGRAAALVLAAAAERQPRELTAPKVIRDGVNRNLTAFPAISWTLPRAAFGSGFVVRISLEASGRP
jgi:hypothetical protein